MDASITHGLYGSTIQSMLLCEWDLQHNYYKLQGNLYVVCTLELGLFCLYFPVLNKHTIRSSGLSIAQPKQKCPLLWIMLMVLILSKIFDLCN